MNNGTLHYDHDRDGTHAQVSGCTVSVGGACTAILCCDTLLQCYFRNSRHDTYVMVSYINRQVVVGLELASWGGGY